MIKLINRIKELNRMNKIPMFIAIDQEGGRVNRIPSEFKNLPAANKLAKKSDEENYVKISGDITGQMLNKIGVNMDFAPVLDIKRFPDEHAIGDRAYGVLVGHLKIMNMLGKVPASLSKKFITKYIRKKERYNGLVYN